MASPTQPPPLLEMSDIVKTFPGVVALSGAHIAVGRGEVHGLVGQNGAGKSTLIKILTGALRPDSGRIVFDGTPVSFRTPQHAQANGVSTIYQEINLVPYRSIAENIFMGREPRRFGFIDWRLMNREAAEVLERMGIRVRVNQPLMNLNVATQQMVAIARAVSFNARLVVMDEPTSSLDDREVATLFDVIRRLKRDGVSVIFITHRLDELYQVCDRVTVMRDGLTVEDRAMEGIGKLGLVGKMLGREFGETGQASQTAFTEGKQPTDRVVVEATGLRRGRALQNASVSVNAGEIVGLAGLLGSGRTETARAIFGADMLEDGEVRFEGEPVYFASPRDAIDAGVGFCSENRKEEGIIPYLSVRENLTLAALPMLTRRGIVDKETQRELVDRYIERLGIRTAGPEQPIRELSGGNQQKVLLARWLCLNPKLLILDEPTRGIDVGAKAEIQRLINELADDGLAVLMISSEIEELTEGSDRVMVLRDGRSVVELAREAITADAIMDAMAHGDDGTEPMPAAHMEPGGRA